jgi:hypothetical protein
MEITDGRGTEGGKEGARAARACSELACAGAASLSWGQPREQGESKCGGAGKEGESECGGAECGTVRPAARMPALYHYRCVYSIVGV